MTSRIRAALASTAVASLLAGATILGVGAPAASAADSTANCGTSKSVTYEPLAATYTLTKEVAGNGTVAPGGQVTFRTTVSGPGALLAYKLTDFHPAGFTLVSARTNVFYLVGGNKWADATNAVQKNTTDNSVSVSNSLGWSLALGNANAIFETTYKVPDDATPGTKLNTGLSAQIGAETTTANPIDTCVTIREPNAVENATGSLDDAGLGSVTTGSTNSSQISSDPSGFVADIINGVDLSKLAGS